jgi:hypothetical protein
VNPFLKLAWRRLVTVIPPPVVEPLPHLLQQARISVDLLGGHAVQCKAPCVADPSIEFGRREYSSLGGS